MLEENHDLEKIIEDAKEYRWYSIPDMYVVEILDTTGRSAGYAQSIFIDKYHKKKQSLLYLSKPAYHRKAPKNSQRLTLYKMED